jgi:hypothetical protein
METVDDIINLADYYSTYDDGVIRTISIDKPEPDFNGNPYAKPIVIPERFKEVVLKMCPEIKDIVLNGYRDNKIYDPMTFNPVYNYLVGVDLYFDETNGMKKSKKEYGDELNDYFKMTFDGMDFVSFHVRSFIFPPEKTNEDKFFEVFGVTEK